MIEEKKNGFLLLKFKNLYKQGGISHFVSTRLGENSKGFYASLNLSMKVGDDSHVVARNRSMLAKGMGITKENLLFPDQCHTNHVKEADSGTSAADLHETDALITQTKGICLCVLAADCVPVLLYDPKGLEQAYC